VGDVDRVDAVNRDTIALYDREAERWAGARRNVRPDDAARFAAAVPDGGVRVDVGCGTGRYTGEIGAPVIALDASIGMLDIARRSSPGALPLLADVSALPFRRRSLAGGWAAMTYHHIERETVPIALADLHSTLAVDAPLDITMASGDYEGTALPGDDFPGRYFACWTPERLAEVVTGAGFAVDTADTVDGDQAHVFAHRARTLPDVVGPGMRVLVCGLNPSVYAADVGVGFARPGNRFWPAAIAAGLVTRDRDARHALVAHGVGLTDLVKRATATAKELTRHEYRQGAARVRRLVEWLQPDAVCFVGLAGYRDAIERTAVAGWQPTPFGDRPAYVMPSTSGLNATVQLPELIAHLRAVVAGP
jgi:double-stranded uracil-DNA glycosylase